MHPDEVLDFWFGADPPAVRDYWFRKSDAFDDAIRSRFGTAIEAALSGTLDEWSAAPEGTLALIVLLDQFTRNAFRDTPRAFAGDAAALGHARRLVGAAADRRLTTLRRWFVYMPFEHSEELIDQYESLRLFGELARDGLDAPLEWARRHFEVVRRFGRFPHRNEILGRASTAEELEFLKGPGSRF